MKLLRNSDGAVLIMIALLMVILIGVTAFAIDFGIVFVANKQLHNAADAGALAGARALGYYRCVESGNPACTPVSGVLTTGSETEAVKPKSAEAVEENSAFGTPELQVADADIILGKWLNSKQEFTRVGEVNSEGEAITEDQCNAVRVIVRKEGEEGNRSIQSFFGRIFDVNEYNTRKESIAAVTGLGKAEPGELVPIAISAFKECNMDIFLTGNGVDDNSCAGWTTISENYLGDKTVQGYWADLTLVPGAEIGDPIEVKGGVVTQNLEALYAVWEDQPHPWEVLVAVYDDSNPCRSPGMNESPPILGFATFAISDVITTGGDKGVYGKLVCGKFEDSRGGGSDLGTYGTIPGLVR